MSQDRKLVTEPVIVAPVETGTRAPIAIAAVFINASAAKLDA